MIVYNPHKSKSNHFVTSEADSLMSHYGAVERTFQRGPPASRRAYGFADTSIKTSPASRDA